MIEKNFITPQILADLDKINKDCIRMHVPPPPTIFVECKVEHQNSGDIYLIQREKCNSWNRNFYNHLAGQMLALSSNTGGTTFGNGALPIKDTSNLTWQSSTVCAYATTASTIVGPQGAYYGIVVGTGTGAESFDGYVLGTPIAHGNAATQLSYTAQTATSGSFDDGTNVWSASLVRVFNNNSGSTIAVSEVGLYRWITPASSERSIMIDRTLLSSAVNVLNGYKLTVTYTITLQFPE